MGRPTEAQKVEKASNGKVDNLAGLTFSPEELNLIHAMLSQMTFAESQAKILAGQLQAKIEQFVGQ